MVTQKEFNEAREALLQIQNIGITVEEVDALLLSLIDVDAEEAANNMSSVMNQLFC